MKTTAPKPIKRAIDVALVEDAAHYETLVKRVISGARVSLWIATANVKEMMVEASVGTAARARGRYLSILDTFVDLVRRGVELRLLHAGIPSRAFREALRKRPLLKTGLAMRRCPRVHLKIIAVDGAELYLGSANFTGAGLGAKGDGRRNFEMGVLTSDDLLLDAVQARFDRIWTGKECGACRLKDVCPEPLDEREARERKPLSLAAPALPWHRTRAASQSQQGGTAMGMLRTALTIRKIARLVSEPNIDDGLDLIGLTQKRGFGESLLPALGILGVGVAIGAAVTLYVQKRSSRVSVASAEGSHEHHTNGHSATT